MGSWEEPAIGEKWIALNIDHFIDGRRGVDGSILYSKKGDWKWHKLGSGRMHTNSDIVGDYLLFSDTDYQLYLCDLSTFPKNFMV